MQKTSKTRKGKSMREWDCSGWKDRERRFVMWKGKNEVE